MNNDKFKEMTPEKYSKLSKEERLEYYHIEVIPKLKLDFNEHGNLVPLNLECFYHNIWNQIDTINSNLYDYCYRIKPKPEYTHFTYEDRKLFMGKEIIDKSGFSTMIITGCNSDHVGIDGVYLKYDIAFENYLFADGSPFGKKVV